ncbi:hypothetical protein [Methanosarcina sp.]|nr:hypothetical protein [Methanosarcina sp.]MDY9927653.1 hypothetical protein [Methanosarcina sp.]
MAFQYGDASLRLRRIVYTIQDVFKQKAPFETMLDKKYLAQGIFKHRVP